MSRFHFKELMILGMTLLAGPASAGAMGELSYGNYQNQRTWYPASGYVYAITVSEKNRFSLKIVDTKKCVEDTDKEKCTPKHIEKQKAYVTLIGEYSLGEDRDTGQPTIRFKADDGQMA